ncbi:hypothetical protein [Halobellus captivus]|uniref:hypothetical protein n=1 Tax=Halobellus captivus TaxID=2592614 RepID=UPI0011A52954|nr:hypothetical protein [Halobellus captivus]
MGLKRLFAYIVAFELIAMGVFFTYLLGAVASAGGVATIDMTQFGEQWIEYIVMVVLTAVGPYALYVLNEQPENQ